MDRDGAASDILPAGDDSIPADRANGPFNRRVTAVGQGGYGCPGTWIEPLRIVWITASSKLRLADARDIKGLGRRHWREPSKPAARTISFQSRKFVHRVTDVLSVHPFETGARLNQLSGCATWVL